MKQEKNKKPVTGRIARVPVIMQMDELECGKTAKSILISCGARLAPFDIKELRDLTEYDEMELDKIGERKTDLFMIMSDTDGTFNFILAMMQSQMFNLLCECADDLHNGKLPVHVRFLLDEFANIGQIPQFDKLIGRSLLLLFCSRSRSLRQFTRIMPTR